MKIYTTLLSNGLDNLIAAKEVHVSLIAVNSPWHPMKQPRSQALHNFPLLTVQKSKEKLIFFFSHEHDVIGKWQNLQNLLGVFRTFSPD